MKNEAPNVLFGHKFRIFLFISFIIILFSIIFIGVFQPDISDDFVFSKSAENLDFIEYIKHWYFGWTGRMTGVMLLYFSFMGNITKIIFGILNGILFIACVYLTLFISLGRKPLIKGKDLPISILSFAAVWFGIPSIGETVFWRTGAAVYLWSLFFSLVFLLPFRLLCENFSYKKQPPSLTLVYSILMFLLGILTGNSQKQIFAAAALSSGLFALVFILKNKSARLPAWLYSGYAGLIAGGVILIAAPGNYIRMDQLGNQPGFFYKILYFLIYIIRVFIVNPGEKLYTWVLVILLLYILSTGGRLPKLSLHLSLHDSCTNSKSFKCNFTIPVIFLSAAFASLAPMFFLPSTTADRTGFFAIFYLISATITIFKSIEKPRWFFTETYRKYIKAILAVTAILLVSDSVYGAATSFMFNREAYTRHQSIIRQKEAGILDVEVKPFITPQRHTTYIIELSSDPDYWVNNIVKDYYGLQSIKIK